MSQKTNLGPVFIVDDEEGIREIVSGVVSDLGYRPVTFSNAKDALAAIPAEMPFLIFSDFRMPGLSGLEFCAEVRKAYPGLAFVMVTGYADKELALQGLQIGLTEIMEKPAQAEKLAAVVKNYAAKRAEAIEAEAREIEEITNIYTEEACDLLAGIDELILKLEEETIDPMVIDALFRKIHSVKGGAASVPGGKLLASIGHEFESALSSVKKGEFRPGQGAINVFLRAADLCLKLVHLIKNKQEAGNDLRTNVEACMAELRNRENVEGASVAPPPVSAKAPSAQAQDAAGAPASDEDGVWVPNEKLDSFMKLSGELIVLKNYFQMMTRDPAILTDPNLLEKKHAEFAYSLNRITDQLQDQIISVRKVRLDRVFSKFPRIVRQTAQEVGKKVKLKMTGLELGVDKNIAKSLGTSLVHMVRNSVDHGIEAPEKREAAGKPPEGVITISATETQGVVQIVISDDGGGLNPDRILKKALENGLVKPGMEKALSREQIQEMIFLPGFSTAEKVSNVSGRGVGMDVVKQAVLSHQGKIRIESPELGKGAAFHIDIPVPKTVMVEQTVLARSKNSVFAVPLTAVSRITSCDKLVVNEVNHIRACQFDGRTIPMRTYDELLADRDLEPIEQIMKKSLICIRHKDDLLGLVVDTIEDQLQAVIRPFDPVVRALPGFKGTTVLGNEDIAYLVSPEEMLNLVTQKLPGKMEEGPNDRSAAA